MVARKPAFRNRNEPFVVYTTWRAFEGKFYECYELGLPYLSPFYSPLIDPEHHWWPFSPALLILAGPLSFRTHLLLLSQGVLSRLLSRSSGLRRWRRRAAANTAAKPNFRSFCRIFTATFSTSRYSFIAFLWYDAIIAFSFPQGFGIGVGTLVMLANIVFADDIHIFVPLVAPSSRRQARLLFLRNAWPAAPLGLERRDLSERAPYVLGLGQHDFRGSYRSLHSPRIIRRHKGHSTPVTAKYETHEHDVLIIGAGGAGLEPRSKLWPRARESALSASRCSARRTP